MYCEFFKLSKVTKRGSWKKDLNEHIKKIATNNNTPVRDITGDIMYIIFHITSHNHLIEGNSNLCVGAPGGLSPP